MPLFTETLRAVPGHIFRVVASLFGIRAARYLRAVSRPLLARVAFVFRTLPHRFGLHISRHRPDQLGLDFGRDIRILLGTITRPVVFDVGANIGQSVMRFRGLLPGCTIHSFEPSPVAYYQLKANTRGIRNVHTAQVALGAASGNSMLLENDHSELSSLRRPSAAAWGTIVKETPVRIMTLDEYCEARSVDYVDLLKVDTQGHDLEVLRGAASLIARGRVAAVFIEVIFADFYEDAPAFDEVYRFLRDRGFRLVSLYDSQTFDGVMRWADVLFLHSTWADRTAV